MRKFPVFFLLLLPSLAFSFTQPADVGQSLKAIKDPAYKYIQELSPTSWKVSLLLQGFAKAQEMVVTVDKGVLTAAAVVTVTNLKPSLRLTEFLGRLNTATNLLGYFTAYSQEAQFVIQYQNKQKLDLANQNSLISALADAAGTVNNFWENTLNKEQ